MKHKIKISKSSPGFTLIELLVVVAIIALLASVALIAYTNARQKSRDAKRLADMTQMVNALELYNAQYKGFPADADNNGIPDGVNEFATNIPSAPMPPDGSCDQTNPITNQVANKYVYIPQGTAYTGVNGTQVYRDFNYYFCLGFLTGNFQAGIHYTSSTGVK